jgi:hypothetical protein
MNNKFTLSTFLYGALLVFFSFSPTLFAEVNFIAWDKKGDKWLQQTSPNFSVNYLKTHQKEATKVLRIAEQVHHQLYPFFKVTPQERTAIILLDTTDNLMGHVSTLEYGEIRVIMSPPSNINDIEIEDDWLRLFLAHEYSYILQMELSQGTWRGLFIAAEFTPAILLEGVAIYLEKNNQLKTDRLSSSSFNMQMRMQVMSKQLLDLQKVIIKNREWPLTSTYIYGAYFIDYLAKTYGEEKLLLFLENYSQDLLSYLLLNNEMIKVYNKDFLTLWQDFKNYLQNEFSEKIAMLKAKEVNGKLLAKSPFIQAMTNNKKGLLVNKVTGEDRHKIQQYQQGQWKKISATRQLRDMDSHPTAGLITTRLVNYVNGYQYNDIFLYKEKKWTRFSDQARFKNIRWFPDGKKVLATRIVAGISELWQLDISDHKNAVKIWQGNENVILGEFDIAPSGEFIVASIKQSLSEWKLNKFDLINKKWKTIVHQSGHENSPQFLSDGSLVFSANYTGVSNIYHLDLDQSSLTQWTDVVGGAFQPLWQDGLGLVFQSYDEYSYSIRHIADPKPISNFSLTNLQEHEKSFINIDHKIKLSEPKPYSTWETIQPHSWLPVLYVDQIRSLIGVNTYGGDALGRHNYEIYALWDAQNQLASYLFEYRYDNRWSLAYLQDYKFVNTSLEQSEPEYQITTDKTYVLQRNHFFSIWEDKLSLHAGFSMSFENLLSQPKLSPVPSDVDTSAAEITTGLALTFDNQEYYLNVPAVGWGHYYDFTFEDNILDSDFNGQKYQTQWRATWDLPGRMTILTRIAAGHSNEDAKKYTVGGNNLKNEMSLFNRNSQAIRGYDDIAQLGQRYMTQRLEVNTWLGRFERNWGLFPLGMGDIAGTFFIDSGSAWDVGGDYDPITGIGAQLQIEFKLGYNYSLPISLGYAYGTDDVLGKDYLYLNFGSNY